MSSFCRTLTRVEVGRQDAGQEVVGAVDGVHHADEVVVDVPEVLPRVLFHERDRELRQVVQRPRQRGERIAQLEYLTLEEVDALGGLVVALLGEDRQLDLADVVVEPVEDGPVGVHNLVDDGIEHRAGPERNKIRPPLQPLAHRRKRARLAMTHVHDESNPDEDQDLPELDGLLVVDVARRFHDHEDRLVVRLELGPLMRACSASSTASSWRPK